MINQTGGKAGFCGCTDTGFGVAAFWNSPGLEAEGNLADVGMHLMFYFLSLWHCSRPAAFFLAKPVLLKGCWAVFRQERGFECFWPPGWWTCALASAGQVREQFHLAYLLNKPGVLALPVPVCPPGVDSAPPLWVPPRLSISEVHLLAFFILGLHLFTPFLFLLFHFLPFSHIHSTSGNEKLTWIFGTIGGSCGSGGGRRRVTSLDHQIREVNLDPLLTQDPCCWNQQIVTHSQVGQTRHYFPSCRWAEQNRKFSNWLWTSSKPFRIHWGFHNCLHTGVWAQR